MFPPIYKIAKAAAAVRALFGDEPRVEPFGEAPEGTPTPYAVWQIVGGAPENYLGNRPDIDSMTIQIDVYDREVDDVRESARALRDAIEPHAHIVAWRGESSDAETGLKRISFDVDWWVQR